MKKKIAIALSGGIDSLVSAHLLKDQGHDVIGIHFLTGYETRHKSGSTSFSHFMTVISKQIGIDIQLLDCSKEFNATVIKYFRNIYTNGQTPNPCMVCNPTIKFGVVLDHAFKLGASHLATGHYAKRFKGRDNKVHLLRGTDTNKDQSYFLALLTQKQLSSAMFPLGEMKKISVRKIARKHNLEPFFDDESQDICFIHGKSYKDFLSDQMNNNPNPGRIEDIRGRVIGKHTGLHQYTIGQRRGINCPSDKPYYVVRIDTKENRLIVGREKDLLCAEFKVGDINWIIDSPDNPITVKTRVRYRSKAAESIVIPIDKKTALVKFKTPQSSVTPGQTAVFYRKNEVLGGGWILPYS